MRRYYIEDVQCGFAEIGISRNRVITIKFREEGKSKWITMADGEGVPDTYLSDEDQHEIHVNPDANEDLFEEAYKYLIHEFNGIDLCEYSDILDSVTGNQENPASSLIKYLVALIRCKENEIEELVKIGIGMYADEVELPEKIVKQIGAYPI